MPPDEQGAIHIPLYNHSTFGFPSTDDLLDVAWAPRFTSDRPITGERLSFFDPDAVLPFVAQKDDVYALDAYRPRFGIHASPAHELQVEQPVPGWPGVVEPGIGTRFEIMYGPVACLVAGSDDLGPAAPPDDLV